MAKKRRRPPAKRKVGSIWQSFRKVNGKKRRVIVKKIGRKKYRVRVAQRLVRTYRKSGKSRYTGKRYRSGQRYVIPYNTKNRGDGSGWTRDMNKKSKELWEQEYDKYRGRKWWEF